MNTSEHTTTTRSTIPTSRLVRILIVLLVLALVFWAGMIVGYRKAEFSYRLGDNYIRAFGHGRGPGTMMGISATDDLIGGHGTVGKVISAKLPALIVLDRDGTEKSILVTNETTIRSARSTTASTTIKNDDFIVVIGTPNDNGSITAKLIRIMPQMSTSTSSTNVPNKPTFQRGPGMMYLQ